MKVILIVVFSITIIKILPPLASVLRSPKVTGPGYRTSVLQLGPMYTGKYLLTLIVLSGRMCVFFRNFTWSSVTFNVLYFTF